MSKFVFSNNVSTTLAVAANSTTTTLTLTSNANFPVIPPGYYWPVTLNDEATQTVYEIVYVISTAGNNLTVLRGQEGTTAVAWNVGDYAFSAATAGALESFASSDVLSGYVELNPPMVQTGSINVTGTVTATGGDAAFAGVNVNGPLYGATTGDFSQDVMAYDFIASRPYGAQAIAVLPLRFNGLGGLVGVGPSSAISVYGITASMLAIASLPTADLIAIDTNGNLAASGNLYATYLILTNNVSAAIGNFNNSVTAPVGNFSSEVTAPTGSFSTQVLSPIGDFSTEVTSPLGSFSSEVTAPTIVQNGNQVIDTIQSSTLSVSKVGGTVTIDSSGSSQIPIGGVIWEIGNGGQPALTLPNYGSWFIEVIYALQETSNSNLTLTLAHTGGTLSSYLSNANGITAFNAVCWINLYGRGFTNVNNQTLQFTLSVSGGSLSTTQPWTVKGTRYA